MRAEENPFASPLTVGIPAGYESENVTDAEKIRKAHHTHELSIKSIGFLDYLAAGFCGLMFLSIGVGLTSYVGRGIPLTWSDLLLFGFAAIFGAILFWVGFGLRRLKHSVRIPAIILSVIGLLLFPIGTLINIYFLYLLYSKKGAMVFSPEYHKVIRQTPHMKYRTSATAWIVLAILVLVVSGGIVANMIFG